MNPPKVNGYDYINFAIATQKAHSSVEAERVQPESGNFAKCARYISGISAAAILKDVNQAGDRFHFITSDRSSGGHLLDGTFLNPIADVETLRD